MKNFFTYIVVAAADEVFLSEQAAVVSDGPVPNSGKGFDISSSLSVTAATCLKNAGYTTISVRGWKSSGTVDTVGCTSLANAKTAGILNRDAYFFPCPTCSASASSQINSFVNYYLPNCTAWS